MQTPSLPPSHAPSPRNAANNSFSEKPSPAAEQFGDLMQRALNDAPAKPHPQNNLHSAPLTDEATSETDKTADDISAEKKRARSKRNSETASAPSPFLGISAAAMATAQPAAAQAAGTAHDSTEVKGSITPVSSDSPHAETADATSTDTETETADPSTQPPPVNADSTTSGASAPTGNSEHSPVATPVATPELAAATLQSKSDPAIPSTAGAAGKSDSDSFKIGDLKATLDQTGIPSLDPHGTSAAKQDVTMKKADKMTKVAGQTEQDLPGITATGGEEAPKGQKLSAKDESHGSEKLETAAMELPLRVLSSVDSPTPTVTAAAATAPAPVDSRVLERTHDIIALHAMRLGEYTADSLHVVVKPGAGIQLSLELRQSARGIEVRAELHKGDFEQLKQHWPELQQRLEARGVRVGTLNTAENFTGSSNQQFQQSKQQSPDQDPLYAGAFAEFALAGSMTEAPAARAARATAYRGWETWA